MYVILHVTAWAYLSCTEIAGASQEECCKEDRAFPEGDWKLRLSL